MSREILGFQQGYSTEEVERGGAAVLPERTGLWSRLLSYEWSAALLYLFLDVVSWLAIYRIAGWFRFDAYYATPFQFFIVNLIQLGVIVTALYFVGGYDRTVEKLTLSYSAEHILAVIAAAAVSAMLVYSAATFDQTMKPSRGVLLLSFAIFLPVSLAYRRWIRQYVVTSSVNRSFLVIGGGASAARFYEAYRSSLNGEQLEFVSVNQERVGQPIAGDGSPIVQGDLKGRLNNLGRSYSGIILAEKATSLDTALLERLVYAQFQETRVYTLESFYETHWRYVPVGIVDPFWPLQTGFQLARTSPKCAERYEQAIPFYHFRHLVKPGITGWAQVNYPYGESDEDAVEKLKYDLYYIRHYSLKLDAMIVLKTLYTMLFGKGR